MKKEGKLLFLFILLGVAITLLSSVSAIDTFEIGKSIDYRKPCINNGTYCSGVAVCNLTYFYPNQSTIISNSKMTNQLSFHNKTLPELNTLGTYYGLMVCCDGGLCGSETLSFEITGNGKEKPSEFVIVGFAIPFLFILFYLIYMMIQLLIHSFSLDYDAVDFAMSGGGYLVLLGLAELQKFYLGNPLMQGWFDLFINIGLWTHIIIPAFSLAFMLTVGQMIKKKLYNKRKENNF